MPGVSRARALAAVAALFAICSCSSAADSNVNKTEIHIAAILPMNNSWMFSLQRTLPAMEVAFEKPIVKRILPNHYFRLAHADSQCNSVAAPLAGFNMFYVERVSAFFGPVCDYSLAPVSRYAPYWNATVVTAGGMAHDFGSSKTAPNAEYPLLTRVGPTFDMLSKSFSAIIDNFGWKTTVKVLYNPDGMGDVVFRFCFLAASAIVKNFRDNGQEYNFYLFHQHQEEIFNNLLREEVSTKYSGEQPLVYSFSDGAY
jgi:hypothetical protein